MKPIRFATFLLLFLSLIACNDSHDEVSMSTSDQFRLPSMPSYDEVWSELEGTGWPLMYGHQDVSLEKRERGWYVVATQHSYRGQEEQKRKLFWSLKRQDFKEITSGVEDLTRLRRFLRVMKQEQGQSSFSISPEEKYYYDICPYFGYQGWEDDVLNALEGKENLTDTLQYALCLAQLQHTISLTDKIDSVIWEDRPSDWIGDDLEVDSLLRMARESHGKYSEAVEAFMAKDHQIEGVYGPLEYDVNLAKNSMEWYFHLLGDKPLSDFAPAKGSLEGPAATLALNYLKTCPANSVLITMDQREFFSLLHLQKNKGVNPTVKIICKEWLSYPRYGFKLKNAYPGDTLLQCPDHLFHQASLRSFQIKEYKWNPYYAPRHVLEESSMSALYDTNNYYSYYQPNTFYQRNIVLGRPDKWIDIRPPESELYFEDLLVLDIIDNRVDKQTFLMPTVMSDQRYNTMLGGNLESYGLLTRVSTEPRRRLDAYLNDSLIQNTYRIPKLADDQSIPGMELYNHMLDIYMLTALEMETKSRYKRNRVMEVLEDKVSVDRLSKNTHWVSNMTHWCYDTRRDQMADELILRNLENITSDDPVVHLSPIHSEIPSLDGRLRQLKNTTLEYLRPAAMTKRIENHLEQNSDSFMASVTKLDLVKKIWSGEKVRRNDLLGNRKLVQEYWPDLYESIYEEDEDFDDLSEALEESIGRELEELDGPQEFIPRDMPEYDPDWDELDEDRIIDG